jgi:hypothetical protein
VGKTVSCALSSPRRTGRGSSMVVLPEHGGTPDGEGNTLFHSFPEVSSASQRPRVPKEYTGPELVVIKSRG